MLKYILRRILIFIPTLLIISALIFYLSSLSPGDPVETMLTSIGGDSQKSDQVAGEKAYLRMRHKLGLDKPLFYASLMTQAYPDTLYKIPKKHHRSQLNELIQSQGNWKEIEQYFLSVQSLKSFYYKQDWSKDSSGVSKALISHITTLDRSSDVLALENTIHQLPLTYPAAQNVKTAFEKMKNNTQPWKHYIPKIAFYGLDNQYHQWLSNFIQFEFGRSYQDKRPIADKIGENIFWTILLSLISIIITYLISIPLGVLSAKLKGTWKDSSITILLFILYSLPSFWIATLAIVFLCQPEYFQLFPPSGVGEIFPEMTFFQKLHIRFYHLVLPIICMTYSSFAFLSRQMRGGVLNVMKEDYVRTAKAKGLSDTTVTWKHIFRNSLLPLITMIANVLPALIAGSVVIEVIFSIPGMGNSVFLAIQKQDYPMVFTVVMMSSLLTMIGYLLADIIYAIVDPRIKYK